MKTVLCVAAGVAVGLTAVIAVLIQLAQQLLPLVVVVVLVAIGLRLAQRRNRGAGVLPVAAAPDVVGTVRAAGDHEETYLRWETPDVEDGGVEAIAAGCGGGQVRRVRTSARPPRAGRRP